MKTNNFLLSTLGLLTLSLSTYAQTSDSEEWQVRTLVKTGSAVTASETLDNAVVYTTGIRDPNLALVNKDGAKELYVSSLDGIIGKVDLKAETYSLVVNDQTIGNNNGVTFSLDGDTLVYTFDNNQWASTTDGTGIPTGIVCLKYALRSEDFKTAYDYAYGFGAYTPAYNPMDKSIYYTSWGETGLYKVQDNSSTGHKEAKWLLNTRTNGANARIAIHPTGKYIYVFWQGWMYRISYNEGTRTYDTPTLFAGKDNEVGYQNGRGTEARFWFDKSYGVFVKNPLYAGLDDEYDFYVTDTGNNCIRKITPYGDVSLFAGTPVGCGAADGAALSAAFDRPAGIAYDEETQTFYVADSNGIRTISNDSATGIRSLENVSQNAGKATIYNLAGQRVGANYRGIVIQNGKKMVRK